MTFWNSANEKMKRKQKKNDVTKRKNIDNRMVEKNEVTPPARLRTHTYYNFVFVVRITCVRAFARHERNCLVMTIEYMYTRNGRHHRRNHIGGNEFSGRCTKFKVFRNST